MKSRCFLVSLICLIIGLAAFTFTADADSGLDFALTQLNAAAQLDFGSYKANIGLSYNLSASKIEYMHLSLRMQPSDIFMAAELSVLCGKPIDQVVVVYGKHKHKGWGHIAKQLGIKPGSAEFHTLKNKANYQSGKIKHKNKNQKNKQPKKW
jgi:hypothetical protein